MDAGTPGSLLKERGPTCSTRTLGQRRRCEIQPAADKNIRSLAAVEDAPAAVFYNWGQGTWTLCLLFIAFYEAALTATGATNGLLMNKVQLGDVVNRRKLETLNALSCR